MQKKLFALDIGTRSVVGIILESDGDQYLVTDIISKEHTERAMLDGQIHDVVAVSKIITEIKQELEKEHGPLKHVSVAAAGRALKTETAVMTMDIMGKPMMTQEDILQLEISAVQQAQAATADKDASDKSFEYYCVGYSVLHYRLDGTEIGSLIDQNGVEASVEIIATFLPKVVVESLIAALRRADLDMQALTLEPIAAINVLIPASMRRLNVALVDIGAGTSDIAITDKGTVIAYGMVPVAGDEITEALSDQMLLDFPAAEEAKRALLHSESIVVEDILGFTTEVTRDEVLTKLNPALDRLAEHISTALLQLNNGKAPKAVMVVGGGSLTPRLPQLLSEKLDLPENRVAVRGIDAIQDLTIDDSISKGPELVTPIGIAVSAHRNPVEYITVYVNSSPVRLFGLKKLTVADCLLTKGIKISKLYGKPGMAAIVNVNGQNVTIPGALGSPPTLTVNGIPASIDDEVQANDSIIAEKGRDGVSTPVHIIDLLETIPRKTVIINQTRYVIEAVVKRNNALVDGSELVNDRDEIICKLPETIEALVRALGLQQMLHRLQPYTVYVNEKAYTLQRFSGTITKNGLNAKLSSSFEDGDILVMEPPSSPPTAGELAEALHIELSSTISVLFNGSEIHLSKNCAELYRGSSLLKETDYVNFGDKLKLIRVKPDPFIFQDVFKHVDIDLPKTANSRFILVKNNKETGFHEELMQGDDLRIMWPAVINKTT